MSSEPPFLDVAAAPPPAAEEHPGGIFCPSTLDTPSLVVQPAFAAARAALRDLVQEYRGLPHAELEVRLGACSPTGHFVADVPAGAFDDVATTLQEHSQLAAEPAREGHDIFARLPDGRRVRMRTVYDEMKYNVETVNCVKTRVREVLFRTDRPDRLAFKVALSIEQPVAAEELGLFLTSDFFRIRQTRRFTYGSSGGADWAYDLTLVWAGRNNEEAEVAQLNRAHRRELEVELISQSYLQSRDDAHVADSVLCKAMDLVRRGHGDVRVQMAAVTQHTRAACAPVGV